MTSLQRAASPDILLVPYGAVMYLMVMKSICGNCKTEVG